MLFCCYGPFGLTICFRSQVRAYENDRPPLIVSSAANYNASPKSVSMVVWSIYVMTHPAVIRPSFEYYGDQPTKDFFLTLATTHEFFFIKEGATI